MLENFQIEVPFQFVNWACFTTSISIN